ncbi:MAG: hypothetical protein FJ309_14870 [Planctomycetes bacterium]|jgi:hypothetical protein|nr:hypothetical protein [Planctomycetota bacterium]
MDAHFREYLGAVAGMQELYGEPAHEHTDFHPQADTADCPLTGGAPAVEPVVVAEVRDSVASADAATFAKAV